MKTFIEVGTWVAVAVLGTGSLALFVWFLTDLKKIMGGRSKRKRGK